MCTKLENTKAKYIYTHNKVGFFLIDIYMITYVVDQERERDGFSTSENKIWHV